MVHAPTLEHKTQDLKCDCSDETSATVAFCFSFLFAVGWIFFGVFFSAFIVLNAAG